MRCKMRWEPSVEAITVYREHICLQTSLYKGFYSMLIIAKLGKLSISNVEYWLRFLPHTWLRFLPHAHEGIKHGSPVDALLKYGF